MTEEEIKVLCKFMIENSNRNITEIEKELLKQAADKSRNWQELIMTMMLAAKER